MSSERFKTEILPLRQQLFRLSMKLLGDVQDAEDAVQESLLKLWHIRDTLESYENPAAFATTVTKNICLDKIKLKKQTKTIDEYFVLIDSDNPQLQLERQDTNKLVRFIIQGLPPLQQQIITMKDVDEYETEEIAEITGTTIEAIRTNLSRARKKVREEYLRIVRNYE
ncbi:MAG TPA: RNA polymerase sigma factor [Bacteroidales bacterium]|nr:RNA polymerase sigma factor [Bacteroidales bacterium]